MTISASLVASRTSGPAPLAVYFDASATTSTNQAKPFRNCLYLWDFDDPAGDAVWAYGSRANLSKNEARGPLAAHVFESAGTYTVTLTVYDGTDWVQETEEITVVDWVDATHGDTLIVAADNDFTGAPAGDQSNSSSFSTSINTTAGSGATYKRILFKAGNTYSCAADWTLTSDGPGIIGKWVGNDGSADPVVSDPSSFIPGNSTNHDFGQWTIMDIDFDGENDSASAIELISGAGGHARDIMFLRCSWVNFLITVHTQYARIDEINDPTIVQDFPTRWFFVECFSHATVYNLLATFKNLVFLGSQIEGSDGGGGHSMRTVFLQGAILSANLIGEYDGVSNALTIRGVDFASSGSVTAGSEAWAEKIIISDNTIRGGDSSWFFSFMQSATEDLRWRHILVERNLIDCSSTVSFGFANNGAGEMSVRNNIFFVRNASTGMVVISMAAAVTDSVFDSIDVYNNSSFGSGTGTPNVFYGIEVSDTPTNTNYQNNLQYAPNYSTTHAPTSGTFGTGGTRSNNSTADQSENTNPYVNAAPDTVDEMQIDGDSYAFGAGAAVPVYDDFYGRSRIGVTNDMGAHQYTEGEYPWEEAGAFNPAWAASANPQGVLA